MHQVTIEINLKKNGVLREMLALFKDVPIIKWPYDKDGLHELPELNTSTDDDLTSRNGSVIYAASLPGARIGFVPWDETGHVDISEHAPGELLLKLEAVVTLDTDMCIVSITGGTIFNKVINQLITPPIFSYWKGGIYETEPDMLIGLDDTGLKTTLANLVECAISGDATFLNIAIDYLLVGYSIGTHITSHSYVEEALERTKCLGLIADGV